MGFLDDTMIADGQAVIDPWSESVVFTPPGTSPTPRTISVIVDRMPPERFMGGNVSVPKVEVSALNSATLGISSAESVMGGTIALQLEKGGSTVTLSIRQRPTLQDGGMVRISFEG